VARKKNSKTKKKKPSRSRVKTSVAEQTQTIAELRRELEARNRDLACCFVPMVGVFRMDSDLAEFRRPRLDLQFGGFSVSAAFSSFSGLVKRNKLYLVAADVLHPTVIVPLSACRSIKPLSRRVVPLQLTEDQLLTKCPFVRPGLSGRRSSFTIIPLLP
jgi:hypothetical protein